MRDDLEQRIMDKFPWFEAQSIWIGEKLGFPMPCECSDGWYDLIYNLCKEIDELYKDKNADINTLSIDQIKSKLATLRFYVSNDIDGVQEIIDKYEALSAATCETCGELGSIRGKRWYFTACNECYNKTHDIKIKAGGRNICLNE